jgi:hypothetical protein
MRSAGAVTFSVIVTALLTAAQLFIFRNASPATRGILVVTLSAATLVLGLLLRRRLRNPHLATADAAASRRNRSARSRDGLSILSFLGLGALLLATSVLYGKLTPLLLRPRPGEPRSEENLDGTARV